MFLLIFSVIRWNFGIFLALFNGGVLLLVDAGPGPTYEEKNENPPPGVWASI